jgi:hypothetical protein
MSRLILLRWRTKDSCFPMFSKTGALFYSWVDKSKSILASACESWILQVMSICMPTATSIKFTFDICVKLLGQELLTHCILGFVFSVTVTLEYLIDWCSSNLCPCPLLLWCTDCETFGCYKNYRHTCLFPILFVLYLVIGQWQWKTMMVNDLNWTSWKQIEDVNIKTTRSIFIHTN